MYTAQAVIIWTCAIVFASVALISVLSLIGLVNIERSYKKALFGALILETVSISLWIFAHYYNKQPKVWEMVEFTDCDGADVPPKSSVRSETPDPDMCNFNGARMAICWTQIHPVAGHWGYCGYKQTEWFNCRGGRNPGLVYKCDP